jgi:3-oxoacyl-[acyl-carrier-protein] synthase-3
VRSAGVVSLAVHYPRRLVDNDTWRVGHPEMLEQAESGAHGRLWASDRRELRFDRAMAPYLSDPFRGVRERRWLEPGQTALSIETAAAREALAVAGLAPDEVDLCLCSSFFPDQWDTGNATWLARELGLRGAAMNLESACSSSNLALQTACAWVAAGRAKNVLCVASSSYSRVTPETNPLSFANGDGAAAFVVSRVPDGQGLLGAYARHTGETCGAVYLECSADAAGAPSMQMRVDRSANRVLRETAEPVLLECVAGALDDAGLRLEDVRAFVFNTPTAWYSAFCADALGIDAAKTISTHALYANTGPVLMPTNCLHAAHAGLFGPGDVVLLYGIGSVSSAAATVLRWSDCALGALPPPSSALRAASASRAAGAVLEEDEVAALVAREPAREPAGARGGEGRGLLGADDEEHAPRG